MIPSLRFRGLTVAKEPKVPLRRFSTRDSAGRGVNVDSVGGAEGVTPRHGLAQELLSPGSAKSCSVKAFSSPDAMETGWVPTELPPSVDTASAHLAGLRGDVRRRITGRVIFALGG